MFILIKESDITECSQAGIVACWSEFHNSAYVTQDETTSGMFSDYETVEEV